jgi:hypothetical protein
MYFKAIKYYFPIIRSFSAACACSDIKWTKMTSDLREFCYCNRIFKDDPEGIQ